MRFSILGTFERRLAQGVALVVLGGLAAGCSSGVARFEDSIFTGSAAKDNRAVAASASSQPYPGEAENRTASLDNTHTGSVNRRVARPDVPVGGGNAAYAGQAGNASPARTASEPVALAPASDIERRPIEPSGPSDTESVSAESRSALDDTETGATAARTPRAEDTGRVKAGWNGEGGSEITAREGETVYNLSRRFGVPVDAILKANGMEEATNLQAGQTLTIPRYADGRDVPVSAPDSDPRVAEASSLPGPAAPSDDSSRTGERLAVLPQAPKPRERPGNASADSSGSPTTSASGGAYVVEAGDTLYGIASKTGADIDRIKAANGLDKGYLQIGQELTIPGAGTGQPTETRETAKTDDVDPVVTGGANEGSGSDGSQVSSYTPPEPSDGGEAGDEETQVAAIAPDSTGIQRLRWPVRGRVVGEFGKSSGSSNDGIDIAVPEGTPVKAAENGVVIYAGDGLKDFGNTVLVRHEDGLVTVYGHAGSLKVERGDEVRRGQELALSGMSGNADRPKLHFEVRKESAPVDPSKYLE